MSDFEYDWDNMKMTVSDPLMQLIIQTIGSDIKNTNDDFRIKRVLEKFKKDHYILSYNFKIEKDARDDDILCLNITNKYSFDYRAEVNLKECIRYNKLNILLDEDEK